MCEFQKIDFENVKNSLPMCDFTKKECTLCVFGNAKTYSEAVKQRGGKVFRGARGNGKSHAIFGVTDCDEE